MDAYLKLMITPHLAEDVEGCQFNPIAVRTVTGRTYRGDGDNDFLEVTKAGVHWGYCAEPRVFIPWSAVAELQYK